MPNSVFLTDGVPFSGQMVGPAADNTAAPPFTFVGDLTSGYASSATGVLDLMISGTSRLRVNATGAGFSSTIPAGLTAFASQVFVGAGVVGGQSGAGGEFDFGYNWYYASGFKYRVTATAGRIGYGSSASDSWSIYTAPSGSADAAITFVEQLRVSPTLITASLPVNVSVASGSAITMTGTNIQSLGLLLSTELTTIAAAATTDTTIQMPAGALVMAVNVRVTTVIPTATSFSVGDSGSATRFSTANVSTAANSTDAGTKAGAYYNASALSVRLTMNGGTPANNTGRVRVTIYYFLSTPPSS